MKQYQRSKPTMLVAACAVAMVGLVANANVQAADWPERTVTIVVPYPAGGATDHFGRAMAQGLEGPLGQSVIVENRAGAGGAVGMGHVARAKADGYTLGLGAIGTQTINQYLYEELPYDAEKDFEPVALIASTPNVLSVAPSSPWETLEDIIEAAKAAQEKGEPLSYGSPGVGSSVHLTSEYLQKLAGIELLHVPFKGVANSLPAVANGEVDLLFDNLAGSLGQIQSGELIRGVAQTGATRNPEAEDMPTFIESGVDLDVSSWFALYAPAGTPQDVIDTLIDASKQTLQEPEIIARIHSLGAEPGTLFGQELTDYEVAQREVWSTLIKEENIKLE